MKTILAATVSALVLSFAVGAAADEKSPDTRKVLTLPVTEVYGRVQRPAAAIEVSKVRMQLPATTPTLAAVARIGDAAKKDPF